MTDSGSVSIRDRDGHLFAFICWKGDKGYMKYYHSAYIKGVIHFESATQARCRVLQATRNALACGYTVEARS